MILITSPSALRTPSGQLIKDVVLALENYMNDGNHVVVLSGDESNLKDIPNYFTKLIVKPRGTKLNDEITRLFPSENVTKVIFLGANDYDFRSAVNSSFFFSCCWLCTWA